MVSSHIVKYDKDKNRIHYYYEDHNTKERVDVEEKMAEWCYAKEADFLLDESDPEPPT